MQGKAEGRVWQATCAAWAKARRQDHALEELKNQSPGAGAKGRAAPRRLGGCSGIGTCQGLAVAMTGPVPRRWRALEDCQQEST